MNIIDFTSYRLEKRLEISRLSTIITEFDEDMREIEKDLILRSYIVFSYAYWESCYFMFSEYLQEIYFEKKISELPFTINEKVSLVIFKEAMRSHRTKTVIDLNSKFVVTQAYEEMLNINDKTINSLEDRIKEEIKDSIRIKTMNPTIESLKDLLSQYKFKLNRIKSNSVNEGLLDNHIYEYIEFIVDQRNNIAHKNNSIIFHDNDFADYNSCISFFLSTHQRDSNFVTASDFLKEIILQIDLLFKILTEEVDNSI